MIKYIIFIMALVEQSGREEEDEFQDIIDPETGKTVPVTSEIGTQIIKNYIECLKNGADSPNIISTKTLYKKNKKEKHEGKKPTEYAEYLRPNQVSLSSIQRGGYITEKGTPKINTCVWIKRSNGKYQLGNIGNIVNDKVDIYFNNNGKVSVKSGLDVNDLLFVSPNFKDKFTN